MNDRGARHLARERGAFDKEDVVPVPEEKRSLSASSQVWASASMDTETLVYMAELFDCTVEEFTQRYK
jgi:hypothetical protein